jgi:hypothetical protein
MFLDLFGPSGPPPLLCAQVKTILIATGRIPAPEEEQQAMMVTEAEAVQAKGQPKGQQQLLHLGRMGLGRGSNRPERAAEEAVRGMLCFGWL